MPLFIREGRIVHHQDVTGVLRSRELNSQFWLDVSLNSTLQAEGEILSITDYNDDSNIVSNCLEESNCVIKISVQASVLTDVLTLNFDFGGRNAQTVFQSITIKGVRVFGVQN